MSATVVASVISAVSALLIAAAGYVFTKRAEREAGWRNEKLVYYKEFVTSLSGAIATETSAEGQVRFARACNNLLLFAPLSVINALDQFHQEICTSNSTKSQGNHDRLLSQLFFEIRKDIGVRPKDTSQSLQIHLWSSGVQTVSELPGA